MCLAFKLEVTSRKGVYLFVWCQFSACHSLELDLWCLFLFNSLYLTLCYSTQILSGFSSIWLKRRKDCFYFVWLVPCLQGKQTTKKHNQSILCFCFCFLPWIFPACVVLSRQLGLVSNTAFIWFCQDCSWQKMPSSSVYYFPWCRRFLLLHDHRNNPEP